MNTQIIATIGPASSNLKILKQMIHEGVNILRLNTKYVSVEEFDKFYNKIKNFKKIKIMVDIKDRNLLEEYKNKKIDYLAVSFAEKEIEIKKIKNIFNKNVKIISKIETKKGVENLDKLIQVSDGIMIARGDLGRNISIEKVPFVQKLITKKCNKKNIMSITATEVMPSMINYVRPSRAEVSDIANAIIEGTESLMLSEETAIGKHPVLVIKNLKKIILETEKNLSKLKC